MVPGVWCPSRVLHGAWGIVSQQGITWCLGYSVPAGYYMVTMAVFYYICEGKETGLRKGREVRKDVQAVSGTRSPLFLLPNATFREPIMDPILPSYLC